MVLSGFQWIECVWMVFQCVLLFSFAFITFLSVYECLCDFSGSFSVFHGFAGLLGI